MKDIYVKVQILYYYHKYGINAIVIQECNDNNNNNIWYFSNLTFIKVWYFYFRMATEGLLLF